MDSLDPEWDVFIGGALQCVTKCALKCTLYAWILSYVYITIGVIVGLIVLYKIVRFLFADADGATRSCRINKKNIKEIEDAVIWITGASSGIGEDLAYEYCALGAKVILSARRVKELERVKEKCIATCGKNATETMVLPLDLLDFKSHPKAFQAIIDRFGTIDILVNNAGRSQRGLVEETDISIDEELIQLNVLGTISVTKAVLPHMLSKKKGHIVAMSSVSGKMPNPTGATYTASKHALQGFFDTLRLEVWDKNIRITNVCPGPVKSEGVMNSFSSVKGQKVGVKEGMDKDKMETDRCAKLIVAGVANHLDELWIAQQPILLFVYLSQYMPNIARIIGKRVGKDRVNLYKSGTGRINPGFLSMFGFGRGRNEPKVKKN